MLQCMPLDRWTQVTIYRNRLFCSIDLPSLALSRLNLGRGHSDVVLVALGASEGDRPSPRQAVAGTRQLSQIRR